MRSLLGLVVFSTVIGAGLLGCHEEFIAPEQPDLAKDRLRFDIDLSGVVTDDDMAVPMKDLSAPDLLVKEKDAG